MTVRTNQLALGGSTPGSYLVYTAPAGFRTIVKELCLNCESGGPVTVYVTLSSAGDSFPACKLFQGDVPDSETVTEERYVVMESGQELHVQFGTGVIRWVFSGTELELP